MLVIVKKVVKRKSFDAVGFLKGKRTQVLMKKFRVAEAEFPVFFDRNGTNGSKPLLDLNYRWYWMEG